MTFEIKKLNMQQLITNYYGPYSVTINLHNIHPPQRIAQKTEKGAFKVSDGFYHHCLLVYLL